ncbi:caspase family protein [Winogradskyella ouciana]|uniref:Caspase family protein n=1 Tax=Winogradskyella ouciana TaxID=2608631 RepID=A0A7K1GG12_9FLAO|nr:caspase family protein [Winogradskyella ouciana]MTE28252.1 caspase family protein [Winogradskyella ouciana]
MRKVILLTLMLAFSLNAMAEKYGLIIAVGDYPAKTGWSSISSVNDVQLIKNTLLDQNFTESNILVLKNEQATRTGILKAIEDLQSKIKPGDIVVIHYSGHGQQIFDDNGEEIDDKDESIVPYDALVKYVPNVYDGQNHIRDDEIGNIIANFRNALGKSGQLLILLDSCHSGSATRGGKARGGEATFAPPGWTPDPNRNKKDKGLLKPTKAGPNASPFVMLSGASADELNYEYEGYGSLSFAFNKAMSELGSDVTYRKLFSSIAANMNVIAPNQSPTIEGDVDYKLFGGEYVKQQPYFEVSKVSREDIIKINAGKLQGLFNETTVKILPAGTTKVDDNKVIAQGKITNAFFNEAIIRLDSPLNTKNAKEYWVFIDELTYGDIKMNLYIDKSVKSKSVKKALESFLNEKKVGAIVKDSLDANLIIAESKDTLSVLTVRGQETALNSDEAIYRQTKIDGDYNFEDITNTLFNYAQGSYLKNLSLKNYDYEFEFRLLPGKYDEDTDTVEFIEEDAFTDEAGKFKVNTNNDIVFLEVTNKSEKPLYFSIIEINSKGEIAPFMPNDVYQINDNERLLAPGKTMVFEDCPYEFGDPYETLILKGFATPKPINFRPTVKTRGPVTTRGPGGNNPLEDFVGETFTQTRGSGGNKGARLKGKIDGYSTEFVYEIVKSKE